MNLLRQSSVISVVSAVVLAVLAVVRGFVAPVVAEGVGCSVMPLTMWLEGAREVGLGLYVPLVVVVIALCMVNTLSASLYNVDAGGRSTLPLQTWVLMGCCACFPVQSLSSFVAAWLMTIAMKQVAKAYKRSYSFGAVFIASFVMGMLPLIHAHFVVLLVLLPLVWLLTKRTSRELFVGVVGGVLPLFVASYVYWLQGEGFGTVFRMLGEGFGGANGFKMMHLGGLQIEVMAMWIAVAVMFSVGMIGSSASMRSKARVTGYLQIILLAVLAVTPLLGGGGAMMVPTLAVLTALLSPKAFGRGYAFWSSTIYTVFEASVVCYNIYLFACL